MHKRRKAVGLISGGLDSVIAMRLIMEQGIEATGLYILTPFVSGFGLKTLASLKQLSESEGFTLKIAETGNGYIDMIKNPRYGYGRNLNPCVDCHIYMLRKAARLMEEEGADFVFTGEVLGQRGKSQTKRALSLVEEGSGLKGKLLRPLSAGILPATAAESAGIVDRKRLLSIEGKTRVQQIAVAEEKKLKYYQTPAGGCLLTEKGFCSRLKDLIENKPGAERNDYLLLQTGRHFRLSPVSKVIIPRNGDESEKIEFLAGKDKHLLSSPEKPGVAALVDGKLETVALEIFAAYISDREISVRVDGPDGRSTARIAGSKNKFEYHRYLL